MMILSWMDQTCELWIEWWGAPKTKLRMTGIIQIHTGDRIRGAQYEVLRSINNNHTFLPSILPSLIPLQAMRFDRENVALWSSQILAPTGLGGWVLALTQKNPFSPT